MVVIWMGLNVLLLLFFKEDRMISVLKECVIGKDWKFDN